MKTQISKPARERTGYTKEYKQEALSLWRASGRSAAKVAAELSLRIPRIVLILLHSPGWPHHCTRPNMEQHLAETKWLGRSKQGESIAKKAATVSGEEREVTSDLPSALQASR